jgi:hypothetical protein
VSQARASYAEAGAAMRQAIDRALAASLGPRQWAVVAVVLELTASYSKLSDDLYLAEIAARVFRTDEPTTWQVKRISADLKDLAAAGIIEREPPRIGRPAAGGPRYRVVLPAAGKGAADGSLSGAKGTKGSSERAEREQRARVKGAASARKGSSQRGSYREGTEESSEKNARRTSSQQLALMPNGDHPQAGDTTLPVVEQLCNRLADSIEQRGSKRPTVTRAWCTDMDRLLRIDGRDPDDVVWVIDWLTAGRDEVAAFWAPNVRSPRKLRDKWDTMREQHERRRRTDRHARDIDGIRRAAQREAGPAGPAPPPQRRTS